METVISVFVLAISGTLCLGVCAAIIVGLVLAKGRKAVGAQMEVKEVKRLKTTDPTPGGIFPRPPKPPPMNDRADAGIFLRPEIPEDAETPKSPARSRPTITPPPEEGDK